MNYLSEIVSFIVGLIGGSLLTLQFTRNKVRGAGSVVDQNKATAGGDIVGGNKSTRDSK